MEDVDDNNFLHSPKFNGTLTELDEEGVSDLISSLGFPFYNAQVKEHGITGEILIHLDHEALKDVGIHSVGQRLTILKEVYRLKVLQNIAIEEGHYIPPYEDMNLYVEDRTSSPITSQQILDMLSERDDRIANLEMEVQRLHQSLASLREESLPPRPHSKTSVRPGIKSPTHNLFSHHHPLSNSATHNPNPNTRTLEPNLGLPDSPNSPMDSPRLNDLPESTTSSRMNSTNTNTTHTGGNEYTVPNYTNSTALSPTSLISEVRNDEISPPTGSSNFSSITSPSSINPSTITLPSSSTIINRPSNSNTSGGEKDKGGERSANSDNPYRSFRVTLDDPCYKVLPAALKKYKIIDDWRQYALFICYGNTERCLSYDEKPLLLFQKLKDGNANPVFMLRHIKDIKSPIAVATAKHALRRDKRPSNAGIGLDKPPAIARDGTALPILVRNNRLHYPPVLLPVGKDKLSGTGEEDEESNNRMPSSPRESPGYCISIYPYLAEREDEFDVAVGDTFIIISKTKGWWVVYRDLGPSIPVDLLTRKSAWVPAGCLLETSVPPLSLPDPNPTSNSTTTPSAANIPIEPNFVISVSTPGIALMDYVKNGSDQLDVKKGVQLRILKRYNHWSYAIKEDGNRGWIPSWFCGRTPSRDTPTTVGARGEDEQMRVLNPPTS